MQTFNFLVALLGLFSAGRLIFGLILSNLHEIRDQCHHPQHLAPLSRSSQVLALQTMFGVKPRPRTVKPAKASNPNKYMPAMSIVIPAFNEAKTIDSCVQSVIHQTYRRKQVIVVDDGSTDGTGELLDQLQEVLYQSPELDQYFDQQIPRDQRLVVIHQSNGGKSVALNHGLRQAAIGELVTVLDADSYLAPSALDNMRKHFADAKTIAVASNVRIAHPHNWLDHVQAMEYLLGYRLKGSEEILGLEYIIGGIGSTFRRSALAEINYYDTDTVTEDIDLTLKLLRHFGNRQYRFGYAEDVVAYTPPVHYFGQLLKQRYRWKYGRFKALFKYHQLLWSRELNKYTFNLSWWKLPKVFFEEAKKR